MGGSPADNSTRCVSLWRKASPQHVEKLGDEDVVPLLLPLASEVGFASDSDDSFGPHKEAKCVRFANVEVREYAVTIGDHPCCPTGCPLSLDWDYIAEPVTSLDTYEAQRAPRRNRQQLHTTAADRMRILSQEGGLSDGELRRATRKLHRARSCSARLSEKMSESFFRFSDNNEQRSPFTQPNHCVESASPCA